MYYFNLQDKTEFEPSQKIPKLPQGQIPGVTPPPHYHNY